MRSIGELDEGSDGLDFVPESLRDEKDSTRVENGREVSNSLTFEMSCCEVPKGWVN